MRRLARVSLIAATGAALTLAPAAPSWAAPMPSAPVGGTATPTSHPTATPSPTAPATPTSHPTATPSPTAPAVPTLPATPSPTTAPATTAASPRSAAAAPDSSSAPTAEAAANPAIDALWRQQGGASGWMGAATSGVVDIPGGQLQHFQHADITWSEATGAHYLKDPLRGATIPWGTIGLPVSNDTAVPGGVQVMFQHGALYYSAATGTHLVASANYAKYAALGAAASPLGLPTSDEYATATGARANDFQHGIIMWTSAGGSHAVANGNWGLYAALRFDSGPLGLPTSDEHPSNTGARANDFDNGIILWSNATGSHAVYNANYALYASLGWDSSALGLPTSNEYTTSRGAAANDFQHGVILWSNATGSHAVVNAIYAKYAALGLDSSQLGIPTGNEYRGANGSYVQRFDGGQIIWNPWTGSHNVQGAILGAYAASGSEGGHLGAPTTDEYTVPGGWAQDFVGGRIEYTNGSTKVHTLDDRCYSGHVICVSKTDKKLRWVVDGLPIMVMDARTGDPAYYTPEGSFQIFSKIRDEWSYLYNAPMPFAMYFREGGWAVHYSYAFADEGYAGTSHGCVNTRDWGTMEWLFGQAQLGDRVVIYW